MFFSTFYDMARHHERQHGGEGRLWASECDLSGHNGFAIRWLCDLGKLLDSSRGSIFLIFKMK